MFQWCKYLYNYSQLIYRLYNYSQYFSIHQNHNLILLNNIIESVKKCGSVMIKFCQWITPKLELIYIEENNILNKNGRFIALFFPIERKDEDLEKGPPFYVNLDETLLMFKNNFNIIKIDNNPDSIKPRKGFEALVVMSKK